MIKHNYSNSKIKTIRLWLAADQTAFYYKTVDEPGLMACLRQTKELKLITMPGFMYGALSSTFEGKRKAMIGFMNYTKLLLHQSP